jgi:hypothetical protein
MRAGIARRNEKRAASSREMPRARAGAIVDPDREMPGTMATACPTPTAVASTAFMSRTLRRGLPLVAFRRS